MKKLTGKVLGINSLGRIGKLTLWFHLLEGYFDGYVVNQGRSVGRSLEDVIQSITRDSTYGPLSRFLHGYSKKCDIQITDRESGLFTVDGVPVKILMSERNPKDIPWAKENTRVVVDCTGKFLDPQQASDVQGGSLRGHLEGGAQKVIASAPFKMKNKTENLPADSGMFVFGINHNQYDPLKHHILSAASCTTTGLSHMMKPLLETSLTSHILTASMSTVHAATNTQSILDSVPKAEQKDLRKNRSVLDNIIITSTGAAKALEKILPEIQEIGFMADSVRIPTNTVSLITLNVTFKTRTDENNLPLIDRETINGLYRTASLGPQKGLLVFSDKQNVSSDLKGEMAAVVIEGFETHTRTGFIHLDKETLKELGVQAKEVSVPVTHAKIFGWYDNELGSYVFSLGKLAIHVDKNIG